MEAGTPQPIFRRKIENFKMILLGNTNVGKTCIFDRVTRNEFNEHSLPSLSHSFAQRVVKVSKLLDERGQSMQGLEEMKLGETSKALKKRVKAEHTLTLSLNDNSPRERFSEDF